MACAAFRAQNNNQTQPTQPTPQPKIIGTSSSFTTMLWKRSNKLFVQYRRSGHNHRLQRFSSSNAPSIVGWYVKKLETHPLKTKAFTSGVIACSGDVLSQNIFFVDADYDWRRTFNFFIMGSCYAGPLLHFWFGALNTRLFPGPRNLQRVVQKVVFDQFGFQVLFQPGFMFTLYHLEGRENIGEQIVELTPDLLRANWTLWVPATCINFSVVPPKFQVLFSNVVALFWNMYLSKMSQQPKKSLEAKNTR